MLRKDDDFTFLPTSFSGEARRGINWLSYECFEQVKSEVHGTKWKIPFIPLLASPMYDLGRNWAQ